MEETCQMSGRPHCNGTSRARHGFFFFFLNIYTEIKLIMKAIMKELNDVNQLNDFGH